MKILMICELYVTGLEYQENLLVKYYRKHGHEVTVLTSTHFSVFNYYNDIHDNTTPESTTFDHGAKIIKLRYSFNILHRLKKLRNIYEILRQEGPDLIFLHDISLNNHEVIKYLKRNPYCNVIFDYHADYSNSGKNWISINILHKLIRKRIYFDPIFKYLKRIFPVVPASITFLNEVYDIPMCRMEILPLGADTDVGEKHQEKRYGEKIRSKLGLKVDDIVIFTGGKLHPDKRTDLLVEAVNSIGRSNLHLIIIGDASEREGNYKQKIVKLASGKSNIHLIGWVDSKDIYPYLDAADFAVFPCSQSILWQQAISMSLPLIVGDIGNQSIEYLNSYGNIITLTKEQITKDNLIEKIQLLMSDKEIRYKMSQGAKKVTDELLNWNKLIEKTLK